jgi:hypothetical protein
MDILTLKDYHRTGKLVDKQLNTLEKLSRTKALTGGNTTLSNTGLVKTDRSFSEFHINDVPLSEMLDKLYGSKTSILNNWIGVLGSSINPNWEKVKIKQLLGKKVSDKEIREMYSPEMTDNEFQYYLEKAREELTSPNVIIYCCAECGDPDCGGITATIDKTDDAVIWTLTEKKATMKFHFNKYKYFALLNNRLKRLT